MPIGPSDDVRYGWPGAGGEGLSLAANRIARALARSRAKVIGLLPVDDRLGPPERLAPALLRLAEALSGFVADEVGIVDAWPTWPWGDAFAYGDAAAARIRRVGDRVLEIAPPPCGDAPAASIALANTLAGRPKGIDRVLVSLGGFAPPGVVPPAAEWVDGIVLMVAAHRSRQRVVQDLGQRMAAGKALGAVLLG